MFPHDSLKMTLKKAAAPIRAKAVAMINAGFLIGARV
jgi:hypothetical protein